MCEPHVIEPGGVSFCSPRVSVRSVCSMAPRRGGGLLAGRVAQLSSLRLGRPLGRSGLSGNPPLERHQSRQEETQRDEDDSRMARAVENKAEQSIERAKSQFALRPGRGLEAHKSSSSKAI